MAGFRRGHAPAKKQGESKRTRELRISLATHWPGSYWWKTAGSEFSVSGLPDLFGCVEGFLYGIEVKLDPNWFSDIQIKRLRQLTQAGACAGGVIWSKGQWMWINVEDMGHPGDRRRKNWIPFHEKDLPLYRSE